MAGVRWSMVQRVRFGDLDAMQHLNNVEYLRYFETARIDFLQDRLGKEHGPANRTGLGFIFGECKITFRSPAHYGEEVRTYIEPSRISRSTITLDFEMKAEGDGRLLAEGYGVLVGYDYEAGESRPLPDDLRQRLDMLRTDG
ncbi:MAG: acyl-CoA thioesterase [Thermoleophilaceae bacterium]|nr:acyl-CoA thioesterase [Thermoleophilaceae bacterium]